MGVFVQDMAFYASWALLVAIALTVSWIHIVYDRFGSRPSSRTTEFELQAGGAARTSARTSGPSDEHVSPNPNAKATKEAEVFSTYEEHATLGSTSSSASPGASAFPSRGPAAPAPVPDPQQHTIDHSVNVKYWQSIPRSTLNLWQSVHNKTETDSIPQKVAGNIEKFASAYTRRLVDDVDILAFFEAFNYTRAQRSFFAGLYHGSHRGDYFRYSVLYELGGVWLDIDMEPLAEFSGFLPEEKREKAFYSVAVSDGSLFQVGDSRVAGFSEWGSGG